MAYTLAQIRTLCRQRADQENSQFISDAELTNYVNASYAELYDLLTSRFEDYYLQTPLQFTLSGATSSYALPSDFYKLKGVDFQNSTPNDWVSVRKFNFAERNIRSRTIDRVGYGIRDVSYRMMGQSIYFLPEGDADGTYRLWYIQRFTPLVSDSDTLTNILDFEEYIVVDGAIKLVIKEESDPSALMQIKSGLKERILAMSANRDAGEPERVADVSAQAMQFETLFPRG